MEMNVEVKTVKKFGQLAERWRSKLKADREKKIRILREKNGADGRLIA